LLTFSSYTINIEKILIKEKSPCLSIRGFSGRGFNLILVIVKIAVIFLSYV